MNKNKRIIISIVVTLFVLAGGFTIGNIVKANIVKNSANTPLNSILLPNVKDYYKVRETVKINDISMTIDKIQISSGTKADRPEIGKEYLIVTVTIKNGRKSKISYDDDFQLQSAKGEINDSVVTMINANQTFRSGDIAPNEEFTGTMTFLPLKGATGLSLNYMGDIFEKTKVHFKLN